MGVQTIMNVYVFVCGMLVPSMVQLKKFYIYAL